jgi:addiction module RelE/StbE family toxin
MIRITKHRLLQKSYRKLSGEQKMLFMQRTKLFQNNPNHPLLKTHMLKGDLKGFYAFSLGGNLRVCFRWIDKNTIRLYKIGTHNQVY